MTDPSEPTTPDDPTPDDPTPDEAVSAALDGEATTEELARVESDPALSARLERFAEVSAGVREVPAPPPGAVDDHVAAALAAFAPAPGDRGAEGDPGDAAVTDASGAAPVVDRRDPGFWQRLPLGLIAAAAAVLVVVAGFIGLVDRAGDDTGTDTAAMDLQVEDESGRSAGGSSGAGSDDMSATLDAPLAAPAGPRLAFSDADALAEHLRAQLDGEPSRAEAADGGSTTASGGGSEDAPGTPEDAEDQASTEADADDGADPCGAVELLRLAPESIIAVVPIVLEERPATAVVHVTDDERRLVVVDDQSCTITADRPL